MKIIGILSCLAAIVAAASCSQNSDFSAIADAQQEQIAHVEPPCWWTGMKTQLVLMVNGPQIGTYDITVEGLRGVRASKVETADSPNYAFVTVDISASAQPGTAYIIFSRGEECFKYPYEISAREPGSAMRESFSTADAIYLIMPDRFSNGDPTNDNSPLADEKADYEAFFGRHGGDIQGIRNHLDYIRDAGFTAIWCTPLLWDNEAQSSYHGYACADYYRVDPRIGSNEEYRTLVEDAHAHGIKIISDVVTNHCGAAHWWMQDLPFEDWIHQWPEYTKSNCSFSTQNSPYCSERDGKNMQEGWFDTSMPDMNLDNPHVLQYFKQWAVWLIEWTGLDGLRVDTFPYNEKYPISEWCASVRNEYPNINIVGEIWSENVPQVAYWQDNNPNRDGYDSNLPSVMDFCLMSALGRINTDREDWDNGVTGIYETIANDVYLHDVDNLMVFCGNHDTERIADRLGRDPSKIKLAMALICTLRGFPQMFAGDEIAAVSRDRSQGHGGLRVEFDDNWAEDPVSKDVHDYTRALLRWRQTSEAVQHGRTVQFISRDNTYAFFRIADGEVVFVYVNNNVEPHVIPWGNYSELTSQLEGGANVVTGQTVDFAAPVTVGPKEAMIVEFK